jgi:hypothetical protein
MTHANDESWRASINEEVRRITTLNDTIAGTLNNILVGGSVGLIFASITFLKDIAGAHPAPGSLVFLRVSWLILTGTAAASIASLITSRTAGTLHRDVLAKRLTNEAAAEAELTRKCNRWNAATTLLQRAGLVGLTAGTGLLVWFAMMNLPQEATAMSEKKGTEKQVQEVKPQKQVQEVKPDRAAPKPGERPRPLPERKEDKAYDHDTTNPFLQRPPATPPPADKPKK